MDRGRDLGCFRVLGEYGGVVWVEGVWLALDCLCNCFMVFMVFRLKLKFLEFEKIRGAWNLRGIEQWINVKK